MRHRTFWRFISAGLIVAISMGQHSAVAKEGIVHETGIASIHRWERIGQKICIKDHWHYKTGTGSTEKQARADAIKAWEDFTAWD